MLKSLLPFVLGAVLATQSLAAEVKVVPAAIADGPSTALFTYTGQNLELPQLSSINATSYEWWYFDSVSYPDENGNQSSITIVFFTATAGGFDLLKAAPTKNPSVDLIDITITFANGSHFRTELNETQATFVGTGDNGADGYYDGSNAFFSVCPNLTHASLHISAPEQGIIGTFELDSVAPPHLPGSPLEVGNSTEVVPNLGWFNSIPDANARGNFIVHGEEYTLQGRGYHDKNWGVKPTHDVARVWYWGHATLGGYSIVWGDVLDITDTEYRGIYIAKDNQILAAQFGDVHVRPFGNNVTYPPHISSPLPEGFTITSDDNLVNVTVTIGAIASGEPGGPYFRWSGTVSGSVQGDVCDDGPAFFEQLTFLP